MKAYSALAATLLALVMLCAGGQTSQENLTLPTEQAVEGTIQEYNIIPNEEYYPEGYVGYRYPVRPALASWLEVHPGPEQIQIPDEVIAGMTTEALAQSIVCYPWYGWHSEMMLSSQSSQPAGFVRNWFGFREFPAMQALSQRADAREALGKLDEMYQAFSGPYLSQGIDPQLMLQSAQFGGEGIPDYAHERNFRFISAQGNLRYYLDDENLPHRKPSRPIRQRTAPCGCTSTWRILPPSWSLRITTNWRKSCSR